VPHILAAEGQTYGLYGAIVVLGSGLITLSGVIFTAIRQGRTVDKAAETERKVSLFEEQDRMLVRERERADRAEARVAVLEPLIDTKDTQISEWRSRALAAEERVDKWNLGREGL